MPDELVGLAEIAQLLGVVKTTASKYSKRADFPAPVADLASGRIWRRADVSAWATRSLPLPRPGRPRRP